MNIVYSNHSVYIQKNSIFLAGPTPRTNDVKSWRPEALRFLEEANYKGTVYVPEWDTALPQIDFMKQVEWEYAHLENCKLIVFWVPRKFPEMMGMTTNVEFGSYVRSGRMFYGRPNDAEKCEYLDWLYTKITKHQPYNNLQQLMKDSASYADFYGH